jgi:type IV secretory pathway TraG/TraD family ATPase VirD4
MRQRPLRYANELFSMGRDEQLVFHVGLEYPIRAAWTAYYAITKDRAK